MLKDYENWLWKMVGYRVCVCFMKEQGILHKNTLVTTVMSNLGLYKALDEEGIGYEQTTGYGFITAIKMMEVMMEKKI